VAVGFAFFCVLARFVARHGFCRIAGNNFFLAKGVFLFVYLFKKVQAKALLCMDARRAGQQFGGPRQYF
jgi:hypothetical protein